MPAEEQGDAALKLSIYKKSLKPMIARRGRGGYIVTGRRVC